MSKWEDLHLEEKITNILSDDPYSTSDHHFGPAFLTAYQLAIEFARRYPADVVELGFPIGGEGTGQRNSLSQYLAGELSRNIRSGKIKHIEGGFLSNQHLKDITFNNEGATIRSSLTNTQYTLSMFRCRPRE